LSEETLSRKNHNFYHIYRNKFNNIPLQRLLTNPNLRSIGRTVFACPYDIVVTLKEIFLNNIVEVKFRYTGKRIDIRQINKNVDSRYSLGSGISGISISDTNPYKVMYLFELYYRWDSSYDASQYFKSNDNIVTVILDTTQTLNSESLENGACYFKINDMTLPYAISNNCYYEKELNIQVGASGSITLISITHLRNLPINRNIEFKYYNSFTGDVL
jgi:hypothetical protein